MRPAPDGFRTFTIVWLTQSLSVVGGAMTGFALNVHRVPPPREEIYAATVLIAAGVCIWGSMAYAVFKIALGWSLG